MFEALWKMLGFAGETVASPPVVGISGGNADSASVRAMITQIQSAGAIPLFLGNHARRNAEADIQKIDALVVMGNDADIDPERYGQTRHEKTTPESSTPEGKARANYEYAMLQNAIARKMPVLGVCAGMQRLNVLCGGTLHQHVPDLTGNDDHAQQLHHIAPFTPVELVHIRQDSMLGDISKEVSAVYTPAHAKVPLTAVLENSMHHQAVDQVGAGLRIAAATSEKDKNDNAVHITEAVEADPNGRFAGQFILGVQWHPEFSASPIGKYIAERATHEAQTYAKTNKIAHPPHESAIENVISILPSVKDSSAQVAPGGFTERLLAERHKSAGLAI